MQESEKANDPYFDDESHLIDKNEVGGSKRKLLIWRILVFVLPVLVIVGASSNLNPKKRKRRLKPFRS